MAFSISIIVAYSLVIVVYLIAVLYFYSYYIYNKNKIFVKCNINFISCIVATLIMVCFLAMGIFCAVDMSLIKSSYAGQEIGNIVFCFIIAFFGAMHLCYSILIVKVINRNKIGYQNFRSFDFIALEETIKSKVDIKQLTDAVETKHPRYYSSLMKEFDYILKLINESDKTYSDVLASIVCFNEQYTTKWSTVNNYCQLYLCCLLSIKLQSKVFLSKSELYF